MRNSRTRIVVAVAAGAIALFARPARAQSIALTTSGGIVIGGVNPAWSTGFGAVNGLGLATPVTGATVLSTSNGVLYTTPYGIVISGSSNSNKAKVDAAVSATFAAPGLLALYSCVSGCSSASNYTAISTNVNSPTDVIGFSRHQLGPDGDAMARPLREQPERCGRGHR